MQPNSLYYGDNLTILRQHLPVETVDLVYLDPPFNSSRTYNVLFRDESGQDSDAQLVAFDDTWQWGPTAEATYVELVTRVGGTVGKMIAALRSWVGTNQLLAYLVIMGIRLVELHRVLKPTGSLYLHCDPTASHYLKMLLDAIFGAEQFRNEIVWKRTTAHNDPGRYGSNVDIILFYTKSDRWVWHEQHTPHDAAYTARFRQQDPDGRRWTDDNLTAKGLSGGGYTYEYKGVRSLWRCPRETMERLDAEGRLHFTKAGGIRLKRYLDETAGTALQCLWTDIPPINSQARERLGYPTQKPLALLERIIRASSSAGDLVLDPFAGCGTTIAAAHQLERRWIGIDSAYLGVTFTRHRLYDMFRLTPGSDYQVIGEPQEAGIEDCPVGSVAGGTKGKQGADTAI